MSQSHEHKRAGISGNPEDVQPEINNPANQNLARALYAQEKFELYKQNQAEKWSFVAAHCPNLSALIEDGVRSLRLDAANIEAFHLISESTLKELEFYLSEKTLPGADRISPQIETDVSEKTREGMAASRARGGRLGRISRVPESTKLIIFEKRNAGLSLQSIAEFLNDSKILTSTGRNLVCRWY